MNQDVSTLPLGLITRSRAKKQQLALNSHIIEQFQGTKTERSSMHGVTQG